MKIGIRKEKNGSFYIDKTVMDKVEKGIYTFDEISVAPFNYKVIELDDKYSDCNGSDFCEDMTFNIEAYNARKAKALSKARAMEIKARLAQLSQDFIQVQVGAVFPDIEERKAEFRTLHNELRLLLGKEERIY
ncbi:MAG: hypothetical protein E7640_04365 [Ruminococcaceae bacterium]|nr:hypothetical protein [Oscillospiraceae bacterium]